MNDRSQDEEKSNELTLTKEQGFFDRSRVLRLFIVVVFAACLFFFLHFREIYVEVLELDMPAERYVISQVDFDFYDDEATALLKREAATDIGTIYRVSSKESRQERASFEHFLTEDKQWRANLEHSTFEEMYRAVDLLEEVLQRIRFAGSRTYNKMVEAQFPILDYHIFKPDSEGQRLTLPMGVWEQIARRAFSEQHFHEETTRFLLDYFQKIAWSIEVDFVAQRSMRQRVEAQVPRKFTKLEAGDRIVDQGEIVRSRHIAMMQAMKKALSEGRNLNNPLTIFGSLLFSIVFAFTGATYLKTYHKNHFRSNKRLFLFVTIMVLSLLSAKCTEFFLIHTTIKVLDAVRLPLLVPFSAILICSLIRPGIAIFSSVALALFMSMALAVQHPLFLVINILSSIVVVMNTQTLRRRKEVFIICAKAWLASAMLIVAYHCYQQTIFEFLLISDLVTTLAFMLLTAILVVGLLPLLETLFQIITDVTLMEYMDPSHQLLRRLAIEAPGTYQHSVVVGNISEAAAIAIGANGLFCRAATLYHDIGKLATPHYFTENQQGGVNIHQLLTPLESAQVIIAHVSEGVILARKAGLPEQFIDIIKEHHGTTLVYYFYNKQVEALGEDESKVDKRDFCYMGPKPRIKESVIIMIADSLEAASRSLDEVNEETVTKLVNTIVKFKADDGQFDRCLLTFEELGIIKETMIKTIVAASHTRIKYPKPRESSGAAIEAEAG